MLEAEFSDVWVSGEISGVRAASSGHYYFVLKDGDAQLKCACFRMTARYLKFKPRDGIAVVARGRLDLYEARGEYQLLVDYLEPQGHGALQFAFEQLKAKLAAEGLFAPSRKRPLPRLPGRIGIVTSLSGAVIQDMLNILGRRFPGLHIRVYPALVQGEGSVEAVCRAVRYFSDSGWAEVVILARGGGSLEDLWTFNEEAVARAVAASRVPVVSAVGHETDFTICDFVADLRAPTPSAAAELVVCTREQVVEQVLRCEKSLEQMVRYRLSMLARRLHQNGIERAHTSLQRRVGRGFQRADELERRAVDSARALLRQRREAWIMLDSRLRKSDLRLRLAQTHRRLEFVRNALCQAVSLRLARARGRLEPIAGQLSQLSPLRVLDRGYAIVQDHSGRIIKHTFDVDLHTAITVRLARGRLRASVTDKSDE
jgi:exodeoxyribonuclease VII large subunit